MDNERYLFQLQQEYLDQSKTYMDTLHVKGNVSDLKHLAYLLRCLLAEIQAVKEDILRSRDYKLF
jgi:hypothetical protein